MFSIIPRFLVLSVSGLCYLAVGPTTCESPTPEVQRTVEGVPSLAMVAAGPEEFLGQELALRGRLENTGNNYFRDLRVVLRDRDGHQVCVRPWLPLEVPPGPKGGPPGQREVLSSYLGKDVELQAVVDHGSLKGFGDTYFLRVKSARLIE